MVVGTGAVVVETTATVSRQHFGYWRFTGSRSCINCSRPVTAGTGTVLMANGKNNQDTKYNRRKKNEVTFTQGKEDKVKKQLRYRTDI